MTLFTNITGYFFRLPTGKTVLWCYLIWYLDTVAHHFDPTPSIWLNSAGISALIGFALMLSIGHIKATLANRWQTFRLFFMPFAVSSFSSLTKGRGFILIFPPDTDELITSITQCTCFIALVIGLKNRRR
jgi:hypothetical protein